MMSCLNQPMLTAPFEDKKDQNFPHASDKVKLIPESDKMCIRYIDWKVLSDINYPNAKKKKKRKI